MAALIIATPKERRGSLNDNMLFLRVATKAALKIKLASQRGPTQAGSIYHPPVGARNSPQEAFRQIAPHSGEQCSMGFQPVSGFGDETGRNPNGPFRARTIPHPHLIFRAIQPRV